MVNEQAQLLVDNLRGWETHTLKRIGARIKQYGKMSIADLKKINNAAIVKRDMELITKELAQITGFNIKQIEKIYSSSLKKMQLDKKDLYDYRGIKFPENDRRIDSIVKAYAKSTAEKMINLSKTKALFMTDQSGRLAPMNKSFLSILDKGTMAVMSGSADYNTELRDVIKALGGSGLKFNYGSGVTRSIDTIAMSYLQYGSKLAYEEYDHAIGEELGCDGIEIDWHANPRPSHEFMQGRQFAIGGPKVVDGVKYESADRALLRLDDYNCYHYSTSIILGVSEPRYDVAEIERLRKKDREPIEINGVEKTGYEWTQAMRALERDLRSNKLTKEIAKSSGDEILVKDINHKITAEQRKYGEIADALGLRRDYSRTRIVKP